MRSLSFLVGFLISIQIFSSDFHIQPKSGVLTGKVTLGEKCDPSDIQIFVSKGRSLIYQASNMANGSFEFHLLPGQYELAVISEKGCEFKESFNITAEKVTNLSAKLNSNNESTKVSLR